MPTTPTWYLVSLDEGERVVRSFGNVGGNIAGYVFIDTIVNGSRGEGEVGVRGAHVWLDIDNDGGWQLGEPIVRTRANGRYIFNDLPASTYRVRVFPIATLHFTHGDSRKVKLAAGATVVRNFGVLPGELPIT